jgi:hypothetical protein
VAPVIEEATGATEVVPPKIRERARGNLLGDLFRAGALVGITLRYPSSEVKPEP